MIKPDVESCRFHSVNPLKDYGVERYISEAKSALVASALIPESALPWLPDVAPYFAWLER
jgi:hypothetical protein